MGTGTSGPDTKKIVCPGCGTTADPACTWQQGRCPHRVGQGWALIEYFKRKFKWD